MTTDADVLHAMRDERDAARAELAGTRVRLEMAEHEVTRLRREIVAAWRVEKGTSADLVSVQRDYDAVVAERDAAIARAEAAELALCEIIEMFGGDPGDVRCGPVAPWVRERLNAARADAEKWREMAEAKCSGCDAARADVARLREACQEMLGGHFNLYKSLFGERSNPEDDIVRKQLKAALAPPKDGGGT